MTGPRRVQLRRDQRGASALELGLVAPIMFLLIFGIIQYGYLFWSLTTASATAREAARRLAVGCEWTGVERLARDHLAHPAVELASISVVPRHLDPTGQATAGNVPVRGGSVEVTVSFQSLNIGIPLVPVPAGGVVTQKALDDMENIPDTPLDCTTEPGNL